MADQDISNAIRDFRAYVEANHGADAVAGGTHEFVLVPKGYSVHSLANFKYNDYAERPHRTKQAVTVLDPSSFLKYWMDFHDPASRIFADRDNRRFHAVLDYHQQPVGTARLIESGEPAAAVSLPTLPRWGSHTVTLELRHTEEWKTWTGSNEKEMSQAAMALFIEDNAPDVVDPSAARMYEVASKLEATTEVKFDSSVDLQNGSRKLKYHEETNAKAGELDVPKEFTIAIPIFEGMPRVQIKARLRYKIPNGKLTMSYSLWRHAAAERQAFDVVMNAIADECGSVLVGKP